jgi:putative SOS response-associated peptidase YedK
MCSEYEAPQREMFLERFGLEMPEFPVAEMFSGRTGVYVRRPAEFDSGDEAVPPLQPHLGRWGLVPRETKADRVPDQLKLSTYNARSERMARAFSFGAAWRGAQRCIVPARAIYEPDWRSGKSVRTRFTASNGRLLNIAGLWSNWKDADGVWSGSYTMITLSAKDHELFKHYHRPEKEKRMVAFLHDHECEAWLDAPVEKAMEFIKGYPPDLLVATPAPRLTKLKKVPRKSEAVPEPASDQLDLL